MDSKIFLQKFNSKKSVNTSEGLNTLLKGKRKLLPNSDVSEVVNQYDVYTSERKKCNKIRLTCQVNTICSNVLFNSITEVVKDEGSSGVSFINYGVLSGKTASTNTESTNTDVSNEIYFKSKDISFWKEDNVYQCTRDTQLTNFGYKYHCGIDIFNNHLIRSNTFKTVCEIGNDASKPENFNTIEDMMRNVSGETIKDWIYFPLSSGKASTQKDLHIYKYDDLYTYKECVEKRLISTFEGWVGFRNKPKIKSYKNYKDTKVMGIERPIMYLNGGDFVDMYPDRTLYSFVPKYNPYKNRAEKNWNYCLTYPSSSYTPSVDEEMPDFIDIIEPTNGALKAIYFNENTIADNGVRQLVIYSIAKHGLSVGDTVNIYNTINVTENGQTVPKTELVLTNAKVTAVADEFIFTVFSTVQLSKHWVELTKKEYETPNLTLELNVDPTSTAKTTFTFYNNKYFAEGKNNDTKYYVIDNTRYVNFDKNAQNISYKKVVNGIECDYYIRIFSKIPNFKFASGDTSSEYEIYRERESGETLIDIYQGSEYDFESHVSRLAFAKNSYSDDVGEIVFTDDIDISNLKDNLGRPLTSIYLTITKNNAGYKEWYGFDLHGSDDWNVSAITEDNVEFSHCFGRVTCGIETSIESRYDNSIKSINKINSVITGETGEPLGYNIDLINGDRDNYDSSSYDINSTEVWYKLDKHYYGDLCYYDNYNAVERSIQPIMHRFNTAQRESFNSQSDKYYEVFKYDEIISDDYDYTDDFKITSIKKTDCNARKEGYYYNPHYEIKIKTFDKIETAMPDFLTITKYNPYNYSIRFTSLENHYLSIGDKCVVYDTVNNTYYTCETISGYGDSYKTFTCQMFDEKNVLVSPMSVFNGKTILDFKVFKIDNLAVPSHAKILKDGTCRIIWRNVLNNGFNISDKTVEEYPFTNGAFYINKGINLYVKRQDPYRDWGLNSTDDIFGVEINTDKEDNYIKATDIEC